MAKIIAKGLDEGRHHKTTSGSPTSVHLTIPLGWFELIVQGSYGRTPYPVALEPRRDSTKGNKLHEDKELIYIPARKKK